MRFFKYHGTGNDFIVFGALDREESFLAPTVIEALCRRHTGVGADGIILACPPRGGGDARMRIYNADGSEAEMCGNGIRCLAKYLYEREGVQKERMFIETGAGTKEVLLRLQGSEVVEVEVDMGIPDLSGPDLPPPDEPSHPGATTIPMPDGTEVTVFCLSLGNPHCVLFVPEVEEAPVSHWGPYIERHVLFPHRTNVEFVQVMDDLRMAVRVWERGVGETQACGTGACAAFAAALHTGRGTGSMTVSLPGGELGISVDAYGHIHLAGPAVEVFQGELSPGWRRGINDG